MSSQPPCRIANFLKVSEDLYADPVDGDAYLWASLSGTNHFATCNVGVGFLSVDALALRALRNVYGKDVGVDIPYAGPPVAMVSSQQLMGNARGVIASMPSPLSERDRLQFASECVDHLEAVVRDNYSKEHILSLVIENEWFGAAQKFLIPALMVNVGDIKDLSLFSSSVEPGEKGLYTRYLNELALSN